MVVCFTDSDFILAASLLILQAPAVHAKCKFQTDGINQFTNESVRWTNWTMLKMILTDPYLMVTAITENERKYLGLRLHVNSSQSTRPTKADINNAVVVSESATVMLLMADESVVTLQSEERFAGDTDFAVRNVRNYALTTDIFAKYPVSSENIAALMAQRVKIIRVATENGDLDFEYGKKGSKKLQQALECIE